MPETTYITTCLPLPADEQVRTLPARSLAVIGDPYRDNHERAIEQLQQHLAIAYDLTLELVPSAARFLALLSRTIVPSEADAISLGNQWAAAWEHLESSRTIALGMGRDVGDYDRARAAAKDLSSGATHLDIGEFEPAGYRRYARTVYYRTLNALAAVDALEALQRAVPELVLAPVAPVPELRAAARLPWKWLLLALVALITIAIARYELMLYNRAA